MVLELSLQSSLSSAKARLTELGIEFQAQSLGDRWELSIADEKSILPPKDLAKELSAFGYLRHTPSKTPLLDELPENYSVKITTPKGRVLEFKRNSDSLVWIAGPCALDTRENLENAARALQASGAHILRGGAVKPRTSPHDFQGIGNSAYEWLAQTAHEFGLLAVSEALSESDVELADRYLDIIQVGARNMQNFALLRKLSQTRKPILLKRSPGATLQEWAAAAEYLFAGGNRNVILCERGVRGLERELRYTLDLAGAAFMQHRYKLPVVIDPSHATGAKFLLEQCTAAAIAMKFSGVMLETHPNPLEAKSDALQALRLEEFSMIASRLLK